MTRRPIPAALAAVLLLTACEEAAEPLPEPIRPVRVTVAENRLLADTASLTGVIEAAETAALAFRTGGRVIERHVGVGDRVAGGEIVARLDPEVQRNQLAAAQADLMSALGERDRTEAEFDRQAQLLERGFTTRVRYDEALQARNAARSRVDALTAMEANAQEQLAFTALYADAPGVVTAVGAEPGEVVAAGQMVATLAREGGRDAVFDVPERLLRMAPPESVITVALASDPSIATTGRAREVAPQADPATRTFRVRIGLIDPPAAFRLGAAVAGSVTMGADEGVELPASALVERDGAPAVFVFDPAAGAVSLRPVTVARFDLATVVLQDGVAPGESVVIAGVQSLRPGQRVRLAGATQ